MINENIGYQAAELADLMQVLLVMGRERQIAGRLMQAIFRKTENLTAAEANNALTYNEHKIKIPR